MDSLVKAASEFLAAILAALGFAGRPRRRAAIRQDLELLHELETSADFGKGSWPHQVLANHIALEVAKYSGVELPRRNIPWASVVLATIIGAPLAYWTYALDKDGFDWYSLFPGLVAGLMLISILGMLFFPEGQTSENEAKKPM